MVVRQALNQGTTQEGGLPEDLTKERKLCETHHIGMCATQLLMETTVCVEQLVVETLG